jgi:hypothetical protein
MSVIVCVVLEILHLWLCRAFFQNFFKLITSLVRKQGVKDEDGKNDNKLHRIVEIEYSVFTQVMRKYFYSKVRQYRTHYKSGNHFYSVVHPRRSFMADLKKMPPVKRAIAMPKSCEEEWIETW